MPKQVRYGIRLLALPSNSSENFSTKIREPKSFVIDEFQSGDWRSNKAGLSVITEWVMEDREDLNNHKKWPPISPSLSY